MEKWQRIQKPPSRHRCDYPSFSSTLLDSIYRSIDDETDHRGAPDPAPKKKPTALYDMWAPPVTRPKAEHQHQHQHSKKKPAAVTKLHHHHHHFPSTTSSSSDCSSYGGFSSSEPESNPTRLKPIRTGNFPTRSDSLPPPVPLPAAAAAAEKKKKNLSSIRSRFRDLKKARSPTSPAARLASFLNSIFTSSAGNSRKQKAANAVNSGEESACSTASSYSRSCLVKTPSTSEHAVKRSVRFQLPVDGGNGRREEGRYGRRENKKKTMMTWRGYEEVDYNDDDVASDSSSDLFELENLTAVGRYRNELPVYETTRLGGLLL